MKQPELRYTVVLLPDADGGYVVTVPSLPGCVTQGDSREDALRNAQEAIEVYIEDCRLAGEPIPAENGTEIVEVRISA